jgi:tRNA threonylcarbamoyladenosine dehydratase
VRYALSVIKIGALSAWHNVNVGSPQALIPLDEIKVPDADYQRRFGGLSRLYGVEGAGRVAQAHVVVVGVGGVGSWAAEALARSGVGQLTLIDLDHVAESNINRQVQALGATVGMAKVQALQARIADINPYCKVHSVEAFVDADNTMALLPADASGIVEACDQVRAKLAVVQWAQQRPGRPCPVVVSGAAGGKRLAYRVEVDDLSLVTHDPLLAQLRYRWRKATGAAAGGKALGIACVFSREAVVRDQSGVCAQDAEDLNCHGYGSSVTVTGTFGFAAAGWLLEKIQKKHGLA